jgi:hypothetical protein
MNAAATGRLPLLTDPPMNSEKNEVEQGSAIEAHCREPRILEAIPMSEEFSSALRTIFEKKSFWVPRWERRRVERDLRLQYVYGGHEVAYIDRRAGREVIAIDDDIPQAIQRLSPQDRRMVVFAFPSPWNSLEVAAPFIDESTPQVQEGPR